MRVKPRVVVHSHLSDKYQSDTDDDVPVFSRERAEQRANYIESLAGIERSGVLHVINLGQGIIVNEY